MTSQVADHAELHALFRFLAQRRGLRAQLGIFELNQANEKPLGKIAEQLIDLEPDLDRVWDALSEKGWVGYEL